MTFRIWIIFFFSCSSNFMWIWLKENLLSFLMKFNFVQKRGRQSRRLLKTTVTIILKPVPSFRFGRMYRTFWFPVKRIGSRCIRWITKNSWMPAEIRLPSRSFESFLTNSVHWEIKQIGRWCGISGCTCWLVECRRQSRNIKEQTICGRWMKSKSGLHKRSAERAGYSLSPDVYGSIFIEVTEGTSGTVQMCPENGHWELSSACPVEYFLRSWSAARWMRKNRFPMNHVIDRIFNICYISLRKSLEVHKNLQRMFSNHGITKTVFW